VTTGSRHRELSRIRSSFSAIVGRSDPALAITERNEPWNSSMRRGQATMGQLLDRRIVGTTILTDDDERLRGFVRSRRHAAGETSSIAY
jgi:hypothetical protein